MTNDTITLPRQVAQDLVNELSDTEIAPQAYDALRAALTQPAECECRKYGMTAYCKCAEHVAQPAQEPQFKEADFREWLSRELPDDTIIGNSAWWVDHITSKLKWFVKEQPAQEHDNATSPDLVICPECCTQFRAIPENVQAMLIAAGHKPPFMAQPAQQEPVGKIDKDGAAIFWNHKPLAGAYLYTEAPAQPAQQDAECDHGECFGGKCIYKQPALTDDEIEAVYLSYLASKGSQPMWSFARAVIAAHIKKQGGKP